MRGKVFNPIYPGTASCDNWRKGLISAAKENILAIKEALIAGGNNNYTVKELQGLNHLFQTKPDLLKKSVLLKKQYRLWL